jgi:hypothetical protein
MYSSPIRTKPWRKRKRKETHEENILLKYPKSKRILNATSVRID